MPSQMVLIVTQPYAWYKEIDPVSLTKAQYRQDLKLVQLYTLQIDKVFKDLEQQRDQCGLSCYI